MRIVSYIILGIIILVFFSVNNYSSGNDLIDYPLRSFYHADMSHLIANGISFLALSFMEEIIGWDQLLLAILFIWIFSSILLYLYHFLFPSRKVYTVGFSGVIFGLIVVYYSLLGQSAGVNILGLIISILPQLTMIGISFEGHLAGIIAGVLYIMLFPPVDKRNL